mmetsp:Transcript_4415/g.9961  ORF Transcript_4415/g.9961 Transcript_4415/m.9961 type:complete len:200 (+) Transcript_4415:2128-2727(+)
MVAVVPLVRCFRREPLSLHLNGRVDLPEVVVVHCASILMNDEDERGDHRNHHHHRPRMDGNFQHALTDYSHAAAAVNAHDVPTEPNFHWNHREDYDEIVIQGVARGVTTNREEEGDHLDNYWDDEDVPIDWHVVVAVRDNKHLRVMLGLGQIIQAFEQLEKLIGIWRVVAVLFLVNGSSAPRRHHLMTQDFSIHVFVYF